MGIDGLRFAQPILRSTHEISRRLTSDPNRSSLGLLPSGPDPVGEWLVHRQPPGPYIGGSGGDCKRRNPIAPELWSNSWLILSIAAARSRDDRSRMNDLTKKALIRAL